MALGPTRNEGMQAIFTRLWRKGLAEYDEMEGIACSSQSIDGAMVKAPLALEAVGANPTDREKNGTKRSLLVDGNGIPLSLVVSGAHRHDVALLEPTVDTHGQARGSRSKTQAMLDALRASFHSPTAKAVKLCPSGFTSFGNRAAFGKRWTAAAFVWG